MDEITKIAAEEATKTAGGLMSRLFGPLADGLGLRISEGTRMRVLENQIRSMKKVKEICERENVSIKAVNLKVVLPYLEGVGLEEEPELEKMWANLMVNYLDTEKNLESVVYPEILKQLSTAEVLLINELFAEKTSLASTEGNMRFYITPNDGVKHTISIHNLLRIGLLQQERQAVEWTPPERAAKSMNELVTYYQLSGFGKEFCDACHRE